MQETAANDAQKMSRRPGHDRLAARAALIRK
jgi:hypothetical protein